MAFNSPLQAWIDFDFFANNPPMSGHNFSGPTMNQYLQSNNTPIKPCTLGGVELNCTDVCSNASALFDPQAVHNLVTCGSWAEMQALNLSYTLYSARDFSPFWPVGLNENDTDWGSLLRGDITECFQNFYTSRLYITSASGALNDACNMQGFGIGTPAGTPDVGLCIESLCAPLTLNPDLGGIGVSALGNIDHKGPISLMLS